MQTSGAAAGSRGGRAVRREGRVRPRAGDERREHADRFLRISHGLSIGKAAIIVDTRVNGGDIIHEQLSDFLSGKN